MKKLILCSVFMLSAVAAHGSDMMLPAGGYYETRTGNCDMVAMRNALDNATAARRAVITVVRCEQTPRVVKPRPAPMPVAASCDTCGDVVERVVDRRYFVEETVQQYRPVVHYVPAGTYSRRRPVCNTCDM